jgi:hypothetical protein
MWTRDFLFLAVTASEQASLAGLVGLVGQGDGALTQRARACAGDERREYYRSYNYRAALRYW